MLISDPVTEKLPHETHVSYHLVAMGIPEGAQVAWGWSVVV